MDESVSEIGSFFWLVCFGKEIGLLFGCGVVWDVAGEEVNRKCSLWKAT